MKELTQGQCETVGNSVEFQYVKEREAYKEPETELPATMKIRRMNVPDARKSRAPRGKK